MVYINEEDVRNQLLAAGLILDGPLLLANGQKSRRCHVEGEDKEKRGWYRLHEWMLKSGETMLVGSFGVYHGDDPGTQKIELTKKCEHCGYDVALKEKSCPKCHASIFKRRELTPDQKAALRAKQAEDKKRADQERGAEIERAAAWASEVWRHCVPADVTMHDYLKRKHLSHAHGARIFPGNEGVQLVDAEKEDYKYLATFAGALVIPMTDQTGRVFGLQFILSREKHGERIRNTERDKEYWPSGLSKDAHYFLIGTPGKVLLEAEGYATAVSLHENTGHAVAVAFDAGNVPKVATALRKQFKRAAILACADDDWLQKCVACKCYTPVKTDTCEHCGQPHRKSNAGIARASEAALMVSGAWIAPKFAAERPSDRKGPTDFNDLHMLEGGQAVRAQIFAKLSEMGIDPDPASAPARGALPKGGGGNNGIRKRERPAAVSVMSLDDAVDRFIPLDDGTGAYVFDTWTNKVVQQKQMVALLPAGVRWDDIKRHPVWIRRGAHYFDQVGFDPGGDDPDVKLNTWQGWPMEPKEGSCERLVDLVQYLCCQEQDIHGKPMGEAVAKYLLQWMAYPLQHPGAKMSSAVIMHGPQGTGKSTVFQTLAKIYGKYATVLNQRGLEDKFNADWVDCKLFLLAEEVVTRQEMWHIKNELKELVTGEMVRVNGKNVSAYPQRNHLNMVLLSNENQPLPLENDDRRHLVIYTPPSLSEEYYDAIFQELENGGVEAFYHYLMTLDLTGFHPKKKPPFTQSKSALIALSLPSEVRFVNEWRAGETQYPFVPCAGSHLYKAYLHWSRDNGIRMPRESNQFLGMVARLPGWINKPFWVYEDLNFRGETRKQRMVIPDEAELLKSGFKEDPEGNKTKWLTRGLVRFQEALQNRCEH